MKTRLKKVRSQVDKICVYSIPEVQECEFDRQFLFEVYLVIHVVRIQEEYHLKLNNS